MNPFYQSGQSEDPPDADGLLSKELARNLSKGPRIHSTAFVHSKAVVIGNVTIGPKASVWPCAVLRGDIAPIEVGEGSNIQDGAVVHVADGLSAKVGARVTVGHLAILHACVIGDECLIGMHATVLDGAVIGTRSIVGANSLVTKGTQVPPGSLVMGSPAKVVRALTAAEQAALPGWAEKYVKVAAHHRRFD
ncbi:MAG: gamma carbonic anhydrase family protein [Opitutia bacterium]|nr:gamma carbonic anhydrase family protein [Opitutales bacterium]PHX80237.1 MAG: gamma carbonic anhydrase family protein [Opitutae bacterium]